MCISLNKHNSPETIRTKNTHLPSTHMYPGYPGAAPGGYSQTTTTYQAGGYPGAPMPGAYPGAPMPGAYPGAPGYGAPMGYGAPGGYSQTTTVSSGFPSSWNRVSYQYSSPYSRQAAFVCPIGIDPNLGGLFMQGSAIFRQFDTNWSGTLDKKEFKRAMMALGISFSKGDVRYDWRLLLTNASVQTPFLHGRH